MPTDDVENINGTNQGGDLLFVNKLMTVLRRTERILQGNERNRRSTIYWSKHPQGEQNETQKCSYSMDLLQKDIWYGPAKLDDRLSENVQDIQQSHKAYQGNHERLGSGTDSKKKKLSWGENPEKYLPGRCAITIIICNSNDATELHT